jgi:hypothetical protein
LEYLIITLLLILGGLFVGLRNRNRLLTMNLEMKARDLWPDISVRLQGPLSQEEDLLFGVNQDLSSTQAYLLVKNSLNEEVGRIYYKIKKRIIRIGQQEFLIDFPLTWQRTAHLYSSDGNKIIASYKQYALARHEYEIPGFGTIKSEKIIKGFKNIYNYKQDEIIIGTREEITTAFLSRGKLVILPAELPLEIRLFILSVAP